MLLHEALSVKDGDVVSFVGAGGKTTAALRLMGELAGIEQRVVFTTTTKILEPITRENEYLLLADDQEAALDQIPELLALYPKVFLAKRRLEEVDRVALEGNSGYCPMHPTKLEGISPRLADLLALRLAQLGHPGEADLEPSRGPPQIRGAGILLVEADGARHRALKAPSAYEPVVPASTTILVPMADLTMIGKPLTEVCVHRPELVAGLTGVAIGQPVTAEMVATVVSHPQGGLKGLPGHARVTPILNIGLGIDRTASRSGMNCVPNPLLDDALHIAFLILHNERVERVVVASLRGSEPVLEVMVSDQ